ncbi:glycosyltransferase [Curtobacterium sp. APC 4022]|uniref:glycosyltransferase n=1 Tax=Curtobacterium sp. APC 4022 TaxID=3035201 RepID=UPI0025B44B48|nr:glycosyltransferase [Curtobacterium sp. APC 4022]MDN3478192.1 glycosyltransferase [Curtobacterium sp. APC 4022]
MDTLAALAASQTSTQVVIDQLVAFGHEALKYVPVGIAGVIVWALWLYRVVLSARAKPVVNGFRTTTSVVVPSYHEDPDILLRCLDTWRSQNPDEIIIVLDIADTEAYQRIVAVGDPTVKPILFHHVGKRSALGQGIRLARYDVVVLVDSDTSWEPGLLENVQMPFVDTTVGGVGTQQNVYQRNSSIWRIIADWLVNLRYFNYVPAMGAAGAVPCLSGRTAAYRRSAVLPVLDNLENEFFLGRRCVAGDDGRLTWLVLASGFKTVHQESAKALSMFPATGKAFFKQRIRWSRNSYRTYLTAIAKGWIWRVPFVTKITVLQIILTPVTMGITMWYLLFSRLELSIVGAAFTIAWLLAGRAVRGFSNLRRHPLDLFVLPILAIVVIVIALPIKVFSFITMNKQGWLTRHADQMGGDGQTAATLDGPASRPAVQTTPVQTPPAPTPAPIPAPAFAMAGAPEMVMSAVGAPATAMSSAGAPEMAMSAAGSPETPSIATPASTAAAPVSAAPATASQPTEAATATTSGTQRASQPAAGLQSGEVAAA